MASALLENLSAASTLAASDLFYVKQAGARGLKATGTQLLALVGTTYVPLAGGTMTGALTIASGTLTASAPALNITQTWNEGSTTFTAINLAVTNTASGGGYFFNSFVGGVSQFNVDRGGGLNWGAAAGGAADANYVYTKNLALTNGSTRYAVDVILTRDAAATLAQRNGTTQQIFRLYNTYTDASNYERLTLTGVAGTSVNITAETLGTGGDNLDIVLTPAGTGSVRISSCFVGSLVSANVYNNGFQLASSAQLRWTSGAIGAAADSGVERNAAGIVEVNNGTAGTWRDLKLRNLLAGGGNGSYVQTPSMTVANLAAAATAGAGARAFVTDANATTFLSTVAGGGANKVPVVSDGTNWLIG